MEMCRTCLGSSPPFLPLFSDENYPEKIKILANIDVAENQNEFPIVICKSCIENITLYLEFRTKIQETNTFLEDLKREIEYDQIEVKSENEFNEYELNEQVSKNELDEDNYDNEYNSDNVDNCKIELNEYSLEYELNEKKLDEQQGQTYTLEDKKQSKQIEEDLTKVKKRKYKKRIFKKCECPICHISYSRGFITRHIKRHSEKRTASLNDVLNNVIPKGLIYRCEKCNQYSTESRYNLYKHLMYKVCDSEGPTKNPVLPDGLYSCDKCQYITDAIYKLESHNRNHINRRKLVYTQTTVPCKICGKVIVKSTLRSHLRIHEEKVNCPVCQKTYTKNSLMIHMRCHNRKESVCEICGKVFEYEGLYNQHKRAHGGKKPFKCPICGKSVHNKTRHMQSHTGEKCFACDICGKSLATKFSLSNHRRLHTDERPFKCTICTNSFHSQLNLKNHMRSGHQLVLDNPN